MKVENKMGYNQYQE